MTDHQIIVGDEVYIALDREDQVYVKGIVRYVPVAVGDSWIIESKDAIHYIQIFSCMTKKKAKP